MPRGYYYRSVRDSTGAAITNASIEIENPDTSQATVENSGGGTLTQPLSTDSNGKFDFYAEYGTYTVKVTVDGETTTLPDQFIGPNTDYVDAEIVYAASTSIDRANGGIQTLTLTSNSTLSVTIDEGESLTLHISAGDTYTVTWPTMTWTGGGAPTLTADDVIEFWKVGTTLYGAYVGSVA